MNHTAPFRIIERKDIYSFAAAIILFVGLLVWLITGNVEITVQTNGTVIGDEGVMQIYSLTNGVISELYIEENMIIEAGDPVAEILPDAGGDPVTVYSAYSGFVYHVTPAQWQDIEIGDCIAYITDPDYMPDQVCAVVPREYLSSIVPGETTVRIESNFFDSNTYGYMTGTVESVTTHTYVSDEILDIVDIQAAVDYLLQDNREQYLAIIRVDTDEENYPVFTRDPGGENEIELHQDCNVIYVIEDSHPYEVIFNSRGSRK